MPKKINKNMELWESVETTDPQYTTKVNQRGGFTAIGAQSQLRTATKIFGPMGSGWGVKTEHIDKWEDVGLVIYMATLWYKVNKEHGKDVECYIPIHSSIKYNNNGRVDDDFMKKVATDALTKGLSKLGFNADVFMGKFDDNKYVNSLTSQSSGQDINQDLKKMVTNATKGLSDEDKKKVLSNLNKVNAINLNSILKRIEQMKDSY